MSLTNDELAMIDVCLLKEIGVQRMNQLTNSYLLSDQDFDRIEKFIEGLEKIEKKVTMIKQELLDRDLV